MKIYKKYKVEINVLTPLFISSGDEYSPVELYLDLTAGKLFKIDFNKLAADLVDKDKRLENILLNENTKIVLDEKKIKSELGKDIKNYLSETEFWEIDREGLQGRRSNPITLKIFIKDGEGEPFIPGSTLKGAFHNLIRLSFGHNRNYNIEKVGKLFGFSDFYFKEKQVKVIEIRRNNKIPQLIEAIVSGRAEGELRFYQSTSEESWELDLKIEDLKQLGRRYLQEVKEYGSKKTVSNIRKVEDILKENEKKAYDIVLPLGFGKGYDFNVGGKGNKKEFINNSVNGRRIPRQLWNNKLVQDIVKKRRNSRDNDLVKKIEEIFPSTAWDYKGVPLGWVGMRFSSL